MFWLIVRRCHKNSSAQAIAAAADDALFQISVGHAFDFGVTADLGWRHTEEAGVDTETLGVLFAYTVEF